MKGYLVGKELVILLFLYVVEKLFYCDLRIFFPTWASMFGTLNLTASIPGPSSLTLLISVSLDLKRNSFNDHREAFQIIIISSH